MKSHSELEKSPVVANNAMNRKRQATGENSYAKDVGLDPLSWLRKRQQFPVSEEPVRWLDLCCGEGRALLEVSQKLSTKDQPTELIGLDLVAMFAPELQGTNVRLRVDSVHTWEPTERFDLITCVHGLHYLGDKLDVLKRAAGWLKPTGVFAANLDPSFLVDETGCSLASPALRLLKEAALILTSGKSSSGWRQTKSTE